MKNLIIIFLVVGTPMPFFSQDIEKITLKVHNKNTYFVYDTLTDPYVAIKKEKLPALFGEIDATLIVDLKNKKITVSKSEKDHPYYDGIYTITTDIISYTQKGNVITYYKKGKTWGGDISNIYVTINIKKGTYEQISYTLDNWQTVVFAESVELKIN